ncbi:uncharacterized protein RCO7_14922 [Rhynchosporium graminicola]|uniref:Uncharacterized protein n=1 Tax=Rhynchosporium graminicola TaxID=2792576 RepID=A0A1E1LAC9_9HELO|nr:uncharacterized protein RCO7_14922 [Rhynchosporium commune]
MSKAAFSASLVAATCAVAVAEITLAKLSHKKIPQLEEFKEREKYSVENSNPKKRILANLLDDDKSGSVSDVHFISNKKIKIYGAESNSQDPDTGTFKRNNLDEVGIKTEPGLEGVEVTETVILAEVAKEDSTKIGTENYIKVKVDK